MSEIISLSGQWRSRQTYPGGAVEEDIFDVVEEDDEAVGDTVLHNKERDLPEKTFVLRRMGEVAVGSVELMGEWYDDRPPDTLEGMALLIQSPDGNHLTGKWLQAKDGGVVDGGWELDRIEESITVDVES